VSAKDKATNKEQKITITASTGLTKEEAEKMRVEGRIPRGRRRKRMEEVEARNRLDGIVYQAEKTIRDNRDKLNDADVKQAEEAIEEAKKAVNEGGVARLRSAAENVEKTLHKMAEELYKKAQAAAQNRQGPQALVQVRLLGPLLAAVARRAVKNRRRDRRRVCGRGRQQEAELRKVIGD